MNAPTFEIIERKADQERIRQLFEDFKAAEEPTVAAFLEQAETAFRSLLPLTQGYAIQTGKMKQRASLKIEIDLSPGKRSLSVCVVSNPPPIRIHAEPKPAARRAAVKY